MSRAENRPTRKNKRSPIGRRNVLTAEQKKGFVRRYVNDDPGRIQMFLEAGYKVVDEDAQMGEENAGQASQLGSVAQKPVGGGTNAVLMEIKQDWYQEDQAAKEAQLKDKEQGLLLDENGRSPDSKTVYGEGLQISANNKPAVNTT